ncbi:MAG TPA: thiamine ABC transporter substrate-binding protein [Candidatus Limnocylindria bacterium]|nr:thiamine ABC transporter substrate-binding protein [Candidatus Limnocylindria bacterium]
MGLPRPPTLALVGLLATAVMLTSCSSTPPLEGTPDADASAPPGPTTVTLLTHDSFALSESLLTDFEARTGITVKVVSGGDAGEVVNKAVLTAGNPEGDVLFGVDTTLLTRAVDAGVFTPYRSVSLAELRPELREDTSGGRLTPVDYGDVCVNIDDAWFAERDLIPPRGIDDLTDPIYRDLLVVQNPATSSPGLAFLLATVARYGEDGWQPYWSALRANGVKVTNGWTEAYSGDFSGSSGEGDRPLVVSYASSPPAEIVYAAEPKPTRPGTSVMTDGCFRQVEYAGILAGTKNVAAARAVVDWLVSPEVQADVPLSMFVFPAREDVALPKVFADFAAVPPNPLSLPPTDIAEHREEWVDAWTDVVLR